MSGCRSDTILIIKGKNGQHKCTISTVDFAAAFFHRHTHTHWRAADAGSECLVICHENCITHTHKHTRSLSLCVTWACCRKSFSNAFVRSQLCLNKAAFSGLWMHYSARCVNCAASGYESVSERQRLAPALRVSAARIHPSYNKRNIK